MTGEAKLLIARTVMGRCIARNNGVGWVFPGITIVRLTTSRSSHMEKYLMRKRSLMATPFLLVILASIDSLSGQPVRVVGLFNYTTRVKCCDFCGGETGFYGWEASCCDPCDSPCFSATAGAVMMHRSHARPLTLVTQRGAERANVTHLDLDFAGGPRAGLIWHSDCGLDLELSYFGIDGWSDRLAVADANLSSPLAPDVMFDQAGAAYASELHSAEINLRQSLNCRTTWLAGFRWVELHESALAQASGELGSGNTTIRTHNHLYGYQVGAERILWEGCSGFRLDGHIKAGVYGNSGGHLAVSTGSFSVGNAYVREHHAAFVGQYGFIGRYPLTEFLSVFGGYELMWIDGVALAPNQLPNPALSTDFGDTAFYHGGILGIAGSF